MSKIKIGGIIQDTNLVRVSLGGLAGDVALHASLLERLGDTKVSINFIVHGSNQGHDELLIFCVSKDDWGVAQQIIQDFRTDHQIDSIVIDTHAASVGIYGPDFRVTPGLAGKFIRTVQTAGVSIHAVSTSISTITLIIPAHQADQALPALHQVFELP